MASELGLDYQQCPRNEVQGINGVMCMCVCVYMYMCV